LVLFLVWRRRTTEYSTVLDEASIEPGPFMSEEKDASFCPHENGTHSPRVRPANSRRTLATVRSTFWSCQPPT
jgi:hypothetical protein